MWYGFVPVGARGGLQALGLCLCKDSGTAVLSCLSLGCHLRTPLLWGATCLKAVKLTDQKTVNLKYSQPSVSQYQNQTQPTTTVSPNKPFLTRSLPCQVCVRRKQGPGSQHHPGQSPSKSLELNHCTEPAVRCQLTESIWKGTAHVGVSGSVHTCSVLQSFSIFSLNLFMQSSAKLRWTTCWKTEESDYM